MKLYHAPGACSLAPHIVLREAGYSFDAIKVDLKSKKTADSGDFTQVNGKGYVPVLELDSGERLTEGPAITQYLADQKPESGLAPKAGTMERYRLQEWLNFITSEVHKTVGALFNPAVQGDWRQATLDRITARFNWLNMQLEGKQYLMGTQFTVADAYLFTCLNWTNMVKIDLAPWPAIKSYVTRVAARPKVQEAMKAEGLVS